MAWRWAGGTRSLVRQAGLVGGPLSRWARTGSAGGVPSRTARTGSADRLLGSAVLLSRDGGSLPRPASAGTAAHDGRMRSSAGVLTIIVIVVNLASMLPPPHGPHGPKMPSMTNQFKTPQGRPTHLDLAARQEIEKLKDRNISTRRSVLRQDGHNVYIYIYIYKYVYIYIYMCENH